MSILNYEADGTEDEATFFSLSGEYFEAAETLNRVPPTKINYRVVTYYLLGHSAELTLKSFLFKKNTPINELRRIGHDLSALIDKANEHGIQDFSSLRMMAPIYKAKKLEYRKRKKEEFPSITHLIQEVKELRSIVFDNVSEF